VSGVANLSSSLPFLKPQVFNTLRASTFKICRKTEEMGLMAKTCPFPSSLTGSFYFSKNSACNLFAST
jgi:hypothetical protein